MAKNQTKRLTPVKLNDDLRVLMALLELSDYAPPNPAIQLESLIRMQAELEAAEKHEIRIAHALQIARHNVIRLHWERHNLVLAVKNYVRDHYGEESDVMEMVGLTRKSARRSPARRPKKKAGA